MLVTVTLLLGANHASKSKEHTRKASQLSKAAQRSSQTTKLISEILMAPRTPSGLIIRVSFSAEHFFSLSSMGRVCPLSHRQSVRLTDGCRVCSGTG